MKQFVDSKSVVEEGLKELIPSPDDVSSSKETSNPDVSSTIVYVAITKDLVYDFYGKNGEVLSTSMKRLGNDCYPQFLSFNFYMRDNTLFYISKERQSRLFQCEKAVPLNDNYVAFKKQGNPCWGITNSTGKIVLNNNRYGQIFGITSDENVLCLLSYEKAAVLNLKAKRIIATFPFTGTACLITMNPSTTSIGVNGVIVFGDRFGGEGRITRILAPQVFLHEDRLVYATTSSGYPDAVLEAHSGHFLCDDYLLWEQSTHDRSLAVGYNRVKSFCPIERSNNMYIVEYPGNRYAIYDANTDMELRNYLKLCLFVGDKHYILSQDSADNWYLFKLPDVSSIQLDIEYELFSAAIIYDYVWIVTKYKDRYCGFIFTLTGEEVIGDPWSQYGFLAPYNKKSFVYANEIGVFVVDYNSRKEKLLYKFDKVDLKEGAQLIIPKKDSFIILSDNKWILINSSGQHIISSINNNIN